MKARAARPALSPGFGQFLYVAALIAAATLLAALHLASVARPAFLLGAMVMGVVYMRRSPWAYLTLTLWFWSVAPFARRIVDGYGGFVFSNVILLTPNVLALFMLKDILTSRSLWRVPEAGMGLMALIPILYGLTVSLFRGEIVPGLVSASDWLTPVIYYLYLVLHAGRIRESEPYLKTFVVLNMLVVAPYGLYQYFSPLSWDVQWVLFSKMDTVGHPVPYGMKPFSTLNGPGICAGWLMVLLLLSLNFRSLLSVVLVPAAVFLLALTLVRSDSAATLLGIVVACLIGRGKMAKSVLLIGVALIALAGIVSTLDPRVSQSIMDRLNTVNDLQHDGSAQSRMEIYADTPALIDAHPMGMGIGALGRGARAQAGSTEQGVTDSGPLAIYLALGWVFGTVYIVGFLTVTVQAIMAASSTGSPAALAFAMVALSGAATLLFINLVGLEGTTIWIGAGFAAAYRIYFRSAPGEPFEAAERHALVA